MNKYKILLILAILVLALLPLVSGAEYVGTIGNAMVSDDTDGRKTGFNFTFAQPNGETGSQVKGGIATGDASTTCYLYAANKTLLGSASIISGYCTINATSSITNLTNYWLVADAGGSIVARKYWSGSPSYPTTGNVSLKSRIYESPAGSGTWLLQTNNPITFNNVTVITATIPTSTPNITFQGQTPNNNANQYYTNNNITINTTTNNINVGINTTHYLYNSLGILMGQNNQTNDLGNYTSQFLGLPVGTYYFNATATQSGINRVGQYDGTRQGEQVGSSFNGSQYVRASNLYQNNSVTGTILVWMYTIDNSSTFQRIISSESSANVGKVFSYKGSTPGLYPVYSSSTQVTGITLRLNQVVMLTMTYNGSLVTVYVNETNSGTKVQNESGIGTQANFDIGKPAYGTTSYFNGTIYKVVYWNRSLSSAEVASEYALGPNQVTNLTDGLVLQYLLNKSEGVYSNTNTVFNVNTTSVTQFNQTETRTLYIYNLTAPTFTNPSVSGQNVVQTINLTWNIGNQTPEIDAVNASYYNITIYNTTGQAIISSNTTNTYYYWNTALRELPIGTYNITLKTTFTDRNTLSEITSNVYLNTSQYIQVYIYNDENQLIDNPSITLTNTSTTSLTNPGLFTTSTVYNTSINQYNISLQFNVTDTESYHFNNLTDKTINRLTTTLNITLYRVYLYLNFTRYGTSYNTSGVITDTEPKSSKFTNSSVFVAQSDVDLGKVIIYFGNNITGNWTQYYEYINDKTEITDTLEVLDNPEWYMYFKTYSLSRAPLADVTVRMLCTNNSQTLPTWETASLVGQRLTESDGLTFMWLKYGKTCQMTATKEGYEPITTSFIVGDEDRNIDNPLILYMYPTTASINEGQVWLWIEKTLTGTETSITGYIYSPATNEIKINTSYRESLGLSAQTVQSSNCDDNLVCSFTLTQGIDYQSAYNNITFKVYLDDEYWNSITLNYVNTTTTNIVDDTDVEAIDSNIRRPIMWIALIGLCGLLGLLFKKLEGSTLFKVGILVLAALDSIFAWILLVLATGYVLKWGIKRIVGE